MMLHPEYAPVVLAAGSRLALTGIQSAAASLGVEIVVLDARSDSDISPAFVTGFQRSAEAIMVVADASPINRATSQIAERALASRLPSCSVFSEWVEADFSCRTAQHER
jgi:hypothetical protein